MIININDKMYKKKTGKNKLYHHKKISMKKFKWQMGVDFCGRALEADDFPAASTAEYLTQPKKIQKNYNFLFFRGSTYFSSFYSIAVVKNNNFIK